MLISVFGLLDANDLGSMACTDRETHEFLEDGRVFILKENMYVSGKLVSAISHGFMDVTLRLLLKKTFPPRCLSFALIEICRVDAVDSARRLEIVLLLLDRGAYVYSSAIVSASKNGHTNIASLLLERGINVEGHAEELRDLARRNRHWDIARLLEHRGDDVKVGDPFVGDALVLASKNGRTNIVRLILDLWFDVQNEDNGSIMSEALNEACGNGHLDVASLLIDRGVWSEYRFYSNYKNEALDAACYKGHPNVVRLLIDRGAKVRLYAFKSAIYGCYVDVVNVLLDHLDKVQACYKLIMVEAKAAAEAWGSEEIGNLTELEVQAERNRVHDPIFRAISVIDCCTDTRDEALNSACEKGHLEMVRLLLDRGAFVQYDNYKAMRTASYNGHLDVVRLLLDRTTKAI